MPPASSACAVIIVGVLAVSACMMAVLTVHLRRLRRERDSAAAEAVERAREIFARDLHDLAGQWLYLASVKSEMAYQLASGDAPVRAELAETISAIQNAKKELRNVTLLGRDLSLAEEASRARTLLGTFGVQCRLRLPDAEPECPAGMVLGAAIRESTTNVLRHSTARRCRIEVTPAAGLIRLAVSNDGVPDGARGVSAEGNGLVNLSRRAAELGGRMTASARDGWFHLTVEIPQASSE